VGGDRIAELYRTWGPAIYRRCLRLLRDQEAARDATQEVFRKALSSPEKLADPDTALPFIYRVATNHCLNERRNAGRHGETELMDLDVASDHPAFPQRRLVQRVLVPAGFIFLWSSAYIVVRMGLPDMSPIASLALRFAVYRASWRAFWRTRASTWSGAPHEPPFRSEARAAPAGPGPVAGRRPRRGL